MSTIGLISDDAVLAGLRLTREQQRAAARFVIRRARDEADGHELLSALGLQVDAPATEEEQ